MMKKIIIIAIIEVFHLCKQAADMMANGLVMSHAKFLDFDIGSYMVIEPFRMLVPWPREESRLLAPIRPFQLPVRNAHQNV